MQIQKTVKEETESLNLPAINEEVHIERIPINKIVEKAPEAVTYEGEIAFTIIICRASLVLK